MNDLRAPDPTLTAHPEPVGIDWCGQFPAVAHRLDQGVGDSLTACGKRVHDKAPAVAASYVANPCRSCFPSAPPPGGGHDAECGTEGCREECGPSALAWQVEP